MSSSKCVSDKERLMEEVYSDLVEMARTQNFYFGIIFTEDAAFDNLQCMTTRIWQLRQDGKLRKIFHIRDANKETLLERATREEQKNCAYLIYRLMKIEESRYRAQKLRMDVIVNDTDVTPDFFEISEEGNRNKELPPRPRRGLRLSREKMTNTIKKKMQPKDYFELVKRSRSAHSRFHLDRAFSEDISRKEKNNESKNVSNKSFDVESNNMWSTSLSVNDNTNELRISDDEPTTENRSIGNDNIEDEGFRSSLFAPSKPGIKLPPLLSFRRRTQSEERYHV